MTFLINQILIAVLNLFNACGDYSIIKARQPVNHLKNGLLYVGLIIIHVIVFKMDTLNTIFFSVASMCNRQLSFDIPLNLMRKLPWNYVSSNPNWFDRQEIYIFGKDGTRANIFYGSFFILITLSYLIF